MGVFFLLLAVVFLRSAYSMFRLTDAASSAEVKAVAGVENRYTALMNGVFILVVGVAFLVVALGSFAEALSGGSARIF